MDNWEPFPFKKPELERYLTSLYQEETHVIEIKTLKDKWSSEELKGYGYGNPVLVSITHGVKSEQLVLHTIRSDKFGHERRSDRARNLLLDYETFNKLPRHARSVDVGAFTAEGELLSLGNSREFFNLTEFIHGQTYVHDLQRIAEDGELTPLDEQRTAALAEYLADIHSHKEAAPHLYRRCIRDLLGHGEGVMGMIDGYPSDFALAPPSRFEKIERQLITWRWRIRNLTHRLSQVHGDYHPWNVLFQEECNFYLLDRSRGEWGEPADDVSAMTINYVFFSLRQSGELVGPFQKLYDLFWNRYLDFTGDEEMLNVIQPFYVWRALVLAHPTWYPQLESSIRETLFRFIDNLLAEDTFEPRRINTYLGVRQRT